MLHLQQKTIGNMATSMPTSIDHLSLNIIQNLLQT